jgi:hypothetical protein
MDLFSRSIQQEKDGSYAVRFTSKSAADAAKAMTQIAGKPVTVEDLPPDAMVHFCKLYYNIAFLSFCYKNRLEIQFMIFCQLFVGNLAATATNSDLRALFTPYGIVDRAFVVRGKDGKSKGYAYVDFRTAYFYIVPTCDLYIF